MSDKKAGCCRDKSCTPQTCMVLPEGKTCGACAHFTRCQKIVGARAEYTVCDFFPRRFQEAQP